MNNDLTSLLSNMAGKYLSAHQQNSTDSMDHPQTVQDYSQATQAATPSQIYQAHEQYYQNLPQDQRQNMFSSLLGALQSHGVSPSQAGITSQEPTPQNLAQLNSYVAQKPDLLQKVFGPTGPLHSNISKMIMIGGLAMLAKNTMGKK